MKANEFFGRFIAVRKCVGCGELIGYERRHDAFCSDCRENWDRTRISECGECLSVAGECECMPNFLIKSGALCLRKIFIYDKENTSGIQNKLIYFLKSNNNKRVMSFIADEVLNITLSPAKELGILTEDLVLTNVPRSKKKKLKHGFDQSEEICGHIAEKTGLNYIPVIKRVKGIKEDGKEQKMLTAAQRYNTVKDKFCLTNSELVAGKCVIIFDDLVTTGSSALACTELLNKAGAKFVYVVCIAYTGLKKNRPIPNRN